jgi:hypothetical protein
LGHRRKRRTPVLHKIVAKIAALHRMGVKIDVFLRFSALSLDLALVDDQANPVVDDYGNSLTA